MHEEALIRDLLRRTLALSDAEGGVPVTHLSIWVGALAHLDAEQFTQRFREAASGTAAGGAALSIEVSTDLSDPRAQGVLLRDIAVEDGGTAVRGGRR